MLTLPLLPFSFNCPTASHLEPLLSIFQSRLYTRPPPLHRAGSVTLCRSSLFPECLSDRPLMWKGVQFIHLCEPRSQKSAGLGTPQSIRNESLPRPGPGRCPGKENAGFHPLILWKDPDFSWRSQNPGGLCHYGLLLCLQIWTGQASAHVFTPGFQCDGIPACWDSEHPRFWVTLRSRPHTVPGDPA